MKLAGAYALPSAGGRKRENGARTRESGRVRAPTGVGIPTPTPHPRMAEKLFGEFGRIGAAA